MKFVQQALSNRTVQLALIGLIFLLSYITFSTLFSATGSESYYREIIAALIGTILAAVITTMLLASQTRGEELKERNVEVFRKKVEVYENFLEQILRSTEDKSLSNDEMLELRRSVYRLSLYSSEETIATVVTFLRQQYVEAEDADVAELISAFRVELALENVGEVATWDMQGIETLLQGVDRTSFKMLQAILEEFMVSINTDLYTKSPELIAGSGSDGVIGSGNGFSFILTMASRVDYDFQLDYSNDPSEPQLIEGFLNASELPIKRAEKAIRKAGTLGLEDNDDGQSPLAKRNPRFLVDPHGDTSLGGVYDDRKVWTVGELADAILAIEAIAGSPAKQSAGLTS